MKWKINSRTMSCTLSTVHICLIRPLAVVLAVKFMNFPLPQNTFPGSKLTPSPKKTQTKCKHRIPIFLIDRRIVEALCGFTSSRAGVFVPDLQQTHLVGTVQEKNFTKLFVKLHSIRNCLKTALQHQMAGTGRVVERSMPYANRLSGGEGKRIIQLTFQQEKFYKYIAFIFQQLSSCRYKFQHSVKYKKKTPLNRTLYL